MTFGLLLILAIILAIKNSGGKNEKREVVEEEKNFYSPKRTELDVTEEYFQILFKEFVKKNYGDVEFYFKNPHGLKHPLEINKIVIIKDGKETYTSIWSSDVWGSKKIDSSAAPEPNKDEETEESKSKTDVISFLKKEANNIEKTVQKAMKKGAGFFAYFTVDAKLATQEFMEELVKNLESNTDYDVSFNENVLEINFQNVM